MAAQVAKEAAYKRILRPHLTTRNAFTKQQIPKTLIHDAILNPPIHFWGYGAIDGSGFDKSEFKNSRANYPAILFFKH
ncbi:MAG: hypothetical protein PHU23_09080 [Dehalococcoidales bacterium]|nr:hypothetical protein [Dehalococcoidales bacterium]